MLAKSLMLIFAVCFTQGWTFDASPTLDRSIMEILLRTRAGNSNRDLNTFYQCYSYYTVKMNEAQRRYEVRYQACVRSAEAGIEAANNNTANQRQELYFLIGGSCNTTVVCQKEKPAVAEFNCISNESATISRKLSELSNEAIQHRQELEKQHKLVLHNRDVCTKLNQDTLQQETNDILEEWDLCNEGQITVPPVEATPTASR